jgi:hypothetical protein
MRDAELVEVVDMGEAKNNGRQKYNGSVGCLREE